MPVTYSSAFVHGCSILLGVNSLISTNGLWMELPIMIYTLPEGWALGSYLTAIIQLANIAPIIYAVLATLLPGKFTERPWIYAMLIDGIISAILMATFWDTTVMVNGKEHSIPLFVLTFCLALVDSLSSVVCLPFMAFLKPIYVYSYMIGEGLSGFLPSIAALIQGVNEDAGCLNVTVVVTGEDHQNYTIVQQEPAKITGLRFTVSAFFYFLGGLMIFSFIGFWLLCHIELAKKEYIGEDMNMELSKNSEKEEPYQQQEQPTVSVFEESYRKFPIGLALERSDSGSSVASQTESKENIVAEEKKKKKKSVYFLLLGIQTWVSCLVLGAMPSIQSYSCAPYGAVPFHLAVVLSSMANPVSAFAAIWLPMKSIRKTVIMAVIGTLLASYLMVTAVMSPNPPLVDYLSGQIIMVLVWIIFSSIFGYVKVSVASLLRGYGHRALFWCGVMTQVGATVGAIVMYIFVNVLYFFEEESTC